MAGTKGKSGTGSKKSIEQHKLDGTYREDRHGGVLVPQEKRALVQPLAHITEHNPVVNREEIFSYFADVLHKQGMTQEVDSVILSQLVELQAIYLNALGYYKQDAQAVIGRKLASTLVLETAREIRTIMAEFRLTPSSRTINVKDLNNAPEDPIAAFLSAKSVN